MLAALTTFLPASPADAATVSGGLYQETSADITYTGIWADPTAGATTDSGGYFKSSIKPGATASLTFNSTGISWIGRTNKYNAKSNVYIDGVKKATVDLYSPTTQYQQTLYSTSGLTDGVHTIMIENTATRNVDSQGGGIILDAFKVYDTRTPAAPAGLTATATRTGALVSWSAPAGVDVDSYQLYRTSGGVKTLVSELPDGTTSFDDIGLKPATAYTYSVTVTSQTEKVSPAATFAFNTAAAPAETSYRYANCPTTPTATASTPAQLNAAIAAAVPGSVIRVYSAITAATATGTGTPILYPIDISNKNGTPSQPIWICGTPSATLNFTGVDKNGGIKISNSSNLIFAGMTVQNSQKGISVIESDHIVVADVTVQDIGNEAIHLKNQTTDSTVIGNTIRRTGRESGRTAVGEGVYIGTAQGNWGRPGCATDPSLVDATHPCYNNGQPDRSDRNAIVANNISAATAELIEAKEGAVDGRISANTLDGSAMVMPDSDSPIAIQSNGWVISDNKISNSPKDGVQVWANVAPGYGNDNLIFRNQFSGSVPGYSVVLAALGTGNVAGCDNTVAADSLGLVYNRTCQQ